MPHPCHGRVTLDNYGLAGLDFLVISGVVAVCPSWWWGFSKAITQDSQRRGDEHLSVQLPPGLTHTWASGGGAQGLDGHLSLLMASVTR